MTSKLIVNSIRHTGASADAITMDASGNVTFPANATCSGTATGFGGGITEIDAFRLHSNFQGTTNPITSNWERMDSQTEGKLGTGMSESSGLFTFPSTGYYYVHFMVAGYRGANSTIQNITTYIRTTTSGDTSSGTLYNLSNNTSMYSESGNSHHTQSARLIVKCSNTSNDKVFFGVQAEQYIYIQGSSSANFTYVLFIKLADL